MNEVFADTFYFLALLSPADAANQKARSISVGQSSTLVTTAWVLIELANSLAERKTRIGFLNTFDALRSNPAAVIIGPERELLERGIERYRACPDKDWSLTDCISFVVMERRGIIDALTGDHHFVQAGFQALLR
jgi:hypothetical protein